MAHANTFRDELDALDPKTRIDVHVVGTAQPLQGELEHVGSDYIVVGFWMVQLSHVIAWRLQK